jgi:hypothetical protein
MLLISWIFLCGLTPKKLVSSTCGRFGGRMGLFAQLAVIEVVGGSKPIPGLSVRRVIDSYHR